MPRGLIRYEHTGSFHFLMFRGSQVPKSEAPGAPGNQALANGAKNLIGKEYGANAVYYWMKGYLGFVAPGTAAK